MATILPRALSKKFKIHYHVKCFGEIDQRHLCMPAVTKRFSVVSLSFEEEHIFAMAMMYYFVAEKQLLLVQGLGKGAFGEVSLVRDVATAELFALKDIICQYPAAINGALKEIKTLNSLAHPNIIKLMTADQLIDTQGTYHVRILMKYCSGGNLNDRLTRPDYDAMKNLKWMHQIANALAYLHSCKVVHRDLKPENVLLTDPVIEDVKLADSGLARSFISLKLGLVKDAQCYMQTRAGTPDWMAPEVCTGCYTEKSDMFSLGVLLFAIVERSSIQLENGKTICGAFVSTPTGMVALGYAMGNGYPNNIPVVAFTRASLIVKQLIGNLLSYDYHQRQSASEVLTNLSLQIESKRVILEQGLGKGGFGEVSLVRDMATAELFALKDIICQYPAAINGALKEIKTLNSLAHPNIIKLMAAHQFIDMQGTYHVQILMEYCSGGNLNDRLARPSNDATNLKWMRQIAAALAYLHSCKVVHRDLKPDNVLLTDPVIQDVKLADFGLARSFISLQLAGPVNDAQYSSYMQARVGTPYFMAPEVFAGHYTEKSDMFSLGILFFAIVERGCIQLPNGKRIYGAFVPLGYAMAYPRSMPAFTRASPNVQLLISNLLSSDYHQRMNARDVRV